MELTGKCKEDFEEWVRRTQDWENYYVEWDGFFDLPFAMQWGVLVDFFESEEIRININSEIDFIQAYVNDFDLGNHFQFIQEARKAAIKKANEIYNKL